MEAPAGPEGAPRPSPDEEESAGSEEATTAGPSLPEPTQETVADPVQAVETPASPPPQPVKKSIERPVQSFKDDLMDTPTPPPSTPIPAFSPSGLYGDLAADADHPIAHYLLLPLHEVGAAEWHLDAARPFILKYHPTVGYSLNEASLAACVTVVGGEGVFAEDSLENLRQAGCIVARIAGDGTEIATQLASR